MTLVGPGISTEEIDQILQQTRRAKTAHLRWRAYAMALTTGYSVEEGQLPMEHTDCQFGHWYYSAGPQLTALPEFQAIEEPHKQVHAIYHDIFQLLFNQPEPSFWQKLMGQKAANSDNKKLAEKKLEVLTEKSREMLDVLENLEKVLKDMQS